MLGPVETRQQLVRRARRRADFADDNPGCMIRDLGRFDGVGTGCQGEHQRGNGCVTGAGHIENFLRERRDVVRSLAAAE